MNELQVFQHEAFGAMRTLTENGETLFCGFDVATRLGYTTPRNAINRHCKSALKRCVPYEQSPTGVSEMLFIPLGDVYRLIARSQLPQAQKIEKWIFDEIMPQVTQTGGYIPIAQGDTNEQMMAKALVIMQNTIDQQQRLLEKDKPLVEFALAVRTNDKTISVQEFANIVAQNGYGIDGNIFGTNTLYNWLREEGFLKKDGNSYIPKDPYVKRGYFTKHQTEYEYYEKARGVVKTYYEYRTRITQKGVTYLLNRLARLADDGLIDKLEVKQGDIEKLFEGHVGAR